ncbi:MAG: L,D-transpeptidase [Akkermansia sp.]
MKRLVLILPLLLLAACSSSSTGKVKRNTTPTFEQFVASPTYAMSGDFWRGEAIKQTDPKNSKVIILLDEQRGRLYIGGQIAMDFPVCTGKENTHETPTGKYRISQKVEDHRSSIYGSFVDDAGKIVEGGIRSSDKRPAGTHYRGASMPYWMRFNGSIGIHEGDVWRKSSSHGCVRVPTEVAEILFEKMALGSVVEVR